MTINLNVCAIVPVLAQPNPSIPRHVDINNIVASASGLLIQ